MPPSRPAPPARFIPAHAGNALVSRSESSGTGSSPHTRGTPLPLVFVHLGGGSSPHTRGTLPPVTSLSARFIPAHAGNARSGWQWHRLAPRFIPAHAGNACRSSGSHLPSTVHPRTRGERVQDRPRSDARRRFIPAHAGNARRAGRRRVGRHGSSPHTRGTPTKRERRARIADGSSPHTRGTPRDDFEAAVTSGSSPHTRGTRRIGERAIARSVHPRTRGERSGTA